MSGSAEAGAGQGLSARDRLVFPLDVDTLEEARSWVERLGGQVGLFKIGFQLFYREGARAVEMVHERGGRVFLDLKLYDIPNTVAAAARQLTRLGVYMFNVHASGGGKMMEAAARASREEAVKSGVRAPLILGVTILTSLGDADLFEIGYRGKPGEVVLGLTHLAHHHELDGVVASAREAAQIRAITGADFTILCPGIRPAGSETGDQARVATPAFAIGAGADYLVVGRPIREAADPADAAASIVGEIEQALSS